MTLLLNQCNMKTKNHNYWILFRRSLVDDEEVEAASRYFNVSFQHEEIPSGSVIIPRYSALPFYEYLQSGVEAVGSELYQRYRQHCFVADMQNWYQHLKDVTPKTWFSLEEFQQDRPNRKPDESYVLKGATNSKKFAWKTHMFAKTADDVLTVHRNLQLDSLIGTQPIYIRKYVDLNQVGTKIDGLPVTEEYRVFVCNGNILAKGFYWSEYSDVVAPENQNPENIPHEFLDQVIDAIGDEIKFYVVDVARTKKGNWMVVELNDGCQSGLSCVDPNELYCNLCHNLGEK